MAGASSKFSAKQIVNKLLSEDDGDVDVQRYIDAVPEPEVSLLSPIAPGDGVTAPLRIVLHKSLHNGEWVTHMENMQVGGLMGGRYFRKDYQAALADYRQRCAKLNINPDQSSHFFEPLEEARGPRLKALKKGRKELSKQERKEVERRKAVWDDGHPGVWKSRVNGKTYYVCNTHRAVQVKPTLKGAIRAFAFIKTTS